MISYAEDCIYKYMAFAFNLTLEMEIMQTGATK